MEDKTEIINLHLVVFSFGHYAEYSLELCVEEEERGLFHLLKLRDSNNTLVFITSRPIDDVILAYYLKQIPDLPNGYESRLIRYTPAPKEDVASLMLNAAADDLLVATLKEKYISQAQKTFFHCYQFETQAKVLCEKLGIEEGRKIWTDDKVSGRLAFKEAGLPLPLGTPLLHSHEDLLYHIKLLDPNEDHAKWFLKANESYGNLGNAAWSILEKSIPRNVLEFKTGFIAEEWLNAPYKNSPCFRFVISDESIEFMGAAEELFSEIGAYKGAESGNETYFEEAKEYGVKIGKWLQEYGCRGAFALGFCAISKDNIKWDLYPVDLNVREGGESWPHAWTKGLFGSKKISKKFRFLKKLKKPAFYQSPAQLIEQLQDLGTAFDFAKGEGVILSQLCSKDCYYLTIYADTMERVNELFIITQKGIIL